MDLSFFSSLFPPKFLDYGFNFMAKTQRHFEAPHSISWDGLYYCFNEHLKTGLRQEFPFLSLQFFPHLLLDKIEAFFLFSTHQWWQPKVLLKMHNFVYTQGSHDFLFGCFHGRFAKENDCFVFVHLLVRLLFIFLKDSKDLPAFITTCPTKEEAVICKQ